MTQPGTLPDSAQRVLLFAATTGYQIRSFGDAAARRGVRLMFASDRCDRLDDPWWDGAIPIRFHDPAGAVDAVRRALGPSRAAGVIAVGDRPAALAAQVADALGIRWHPPHGAAVSRNKLDTRRALREAGLPTPRFQPIDLRADLSPVASRLDYPAVIKPLALTGSRGVMRVDDGAALLAAADRLRRLLAAPDVRNERDPIHDAAIVETFIPGREVALDGILTDGSLTPLALFDKPDPLDGPFFEETIYVAPSRETPAMQEAIVAHVARAAAAIGLRHGPIHAECRIAADRIFVLEVAARPIGGLCSRAVTLVGADSHPLTLEDVVLGHALGDDVSSCRPAAGASGVMMIPIPQAGVFRGAAGVEEARATPGVSDIRITATPDARVAPLPEARSYLGFIFASGGTADDVERALRTAHARLRVRIDRDVPVVS